MPPLGYNEDTMSMKLIVNYLKTPKLTLILTLLGMLIFGFVCSGMASHASMHGDMNSMAVMQTAGSQQKCCNASISKHIESWKSTLIIVPHEIRDRLLLLILVLAIVLIVSRLRFQHNFTDLHWLSYGMYARDNPNLALFNHLKLAFARGILNPKVY